MIELVVPWSAMYPTYPSFTVYAIRDAVPAPTTMDQMNIWLKEVVPDDYQWTLDSDNRIVLLLPNEETAIMFKLAFGHIWT